LFKIFQSWGPSAISSVLVIVVLYLIKHVDKNGEDDKKRAQEFQDCLESKIKELRDDVYKTIKELRDDVYKTIEDHSRRLSYIELEYVKREAFYRELGGWREDIKQMSGQISALSTDLNKGIIELWKEKKG